MVEDDDGRKEKEIERLKRACELLFDYEIEELIDIAEKLIDQSDGEL